MNGCINCGRELSFIVDERSERWVHTVEPTGHEAVPSELVGLGRARAIAEMAFAAEFEQDRGGVIDFAWVQLWTRYHGDLGSLPSREQDNDAYREAMASLTGKAPR